MTDRALSQAIYDDSSSVSSFAVVLDDSQYNRAVTNEETINRNLVDQFESSGMRSSHPAIVEITKVTYRNFSVGVFTESTGRREEPSSLLL